MRKRNFNKTNVAICTNPECDGNGKRTVKSDCTACNATGRYVHSVKKPCKCTEAQRPQCRRCHGSGKRTVFQKVVECRRCAGKGYRLDTKTCSVCGHEGSDRYHKRVKATVGSMGELWPTQ